MKLPESCKKKTKVQECRYLYHELQLTFYNDINEEFNIFLNPEDIHAHIYSQLNTKRFYLAKWSSLT